MGLTEFYKIRQKIIFEYLDKYPDAPSNQLARMLYRDHPLVFPTQEMARRKIRYYRGKSGEHNRKHLATKKYLKNV